VILLSSEVGAAPESSPPLPYETTTDLAPEGIVWKVKD
jgi:hypothetical protein